MPKTNGKNTFFLTPGQAKTIKKLIEEKLTDLELNHRENVIENEYFTSLHRYFSNRLNEIEQH